jgi:DMSO reductase anchor subunit
MKPAFSVIFLTTLAGAAQGLFLALITVDLLARAGAFAAPPPAWFVAGAATALALLGLGLIASFFHLGRPERAWRAAAMWRTSWLSREVIVLPAFMAATAAYGFAHYTGSGLALAAGLAGLGLCAGLFVCTAMIYACLRFLQEWASPFTLANFALMGTASGFMLATPLAAVLAPELAAGLGLAALALTAAALASRIASLRRNARLRPKSSLQSAIGVKAPRLEQKSMGFMGGSYNTREFFHGASRAKVTTMRRAFLGFGFLAPMAIALAGLATGSWIVLALAFAVQYAGLLAERWYFFAEANHPQNLYYQCIS